MAAAPSEPILAPEDDDQIAVAILVTIERTISKSDRKLLQFIEDQGRVLVEDQRWCEVCGTHFVLKCYDDREHVDFSVIAFCVGHGLIAFEHDDAVRTYLTKTPTLARFLHPEPPRRRRRRAR